MPDDPNRDALGRRLDETGAELARLVGVARRLVELAVTSEAPADRLAAATGAVAQALAILEEHRPAAPAPRFPTRRSTHGPVDLMPFDPVMGPYNPLAPPIAFAPGGPRAVGTVTFGPAYEGPPGCVHGGIIAAAFDQVLNVANLLAGQAGPTIQLEIRFRRPTPVRTPVRFEGWQERADARRIHTAGHLLAGDRVTVEARGTFAVLSIDAVMRMAERARQRPE